MKLLHSIALRVLPALVPAILAAHSAKGTEPVRVVFFSSDSLTSTVRCMRGAKKVLTRENDEITFYEFLIHQSSDRNVTTIDSIQAINPHVIISIGSSATEFAQDSFPEIPIVFAAVKYPGLSGYVQSLERPGANITGASLNIPVDIQFKYFKRVIPGLNKVGVMYTDNTSSLIPHAGIVARHLGLEMVALKVSDKTDLPQALDSLAKTTQGIWSVADPNLFDPQSTRYILLNAIRKGIPVMGFSRYVVESGALFALDFDYKAVGFQAGNIAGRVLEGENPATIPVSTVDVIWFHYNEKTAKHIAVEIPEELVAIAKEVYR